RTCRRTGSSRRRCTPRPIARPSANGIVYVYMGDAARVPPLPDIAALHIPESEANISFVLRNCNWVQGLEGDIDTSHLNFLHYGSQNMEAFGPTSVARFGAIPPHPEYKCAEAELGTIDAAHRPAGP